MKAYSKDLRVRVVDAVDRGVARPEVAEQFRVSPRTIKRWLRRRREPGRLAASGPAGAQAGPAPGGPAAPTRGAARRHPAGALRPLGADHRRAGLDRDDESGDRRALRLDPEKKSLSAVERDEAVREAWRERVAGIDPARFVFVDETGSHLDLTRRYARSPRGERARGSTPRNRGRART